MNYFFHVDRKIDKWAFWASFLALLSFVVVTYFTKLTETWQFSVIGFIQIILVWIDREGLVKSGMDKPPSVWWSLFPIIYFWKRETRTKDNRGFAYLYIALWLFVAGTIWTMMSHQEMAQDLDTACQTATEIASDSNSPLLCKKVVMEKKIYDGYYQVSVIWNDDSTDSAVLDYNKEPGMFYLVIQ